MTPLHVAAKGGRVKTMKYLIKKRATIDIKDNDGVSNEDILVMGD